jgi:flagellar motor switch protein FliN/FliY
MTDEQNPNLPPDEDENAAVSGGGISESASDGAMDARQSAEQVAAAVDDGRAEADDEFKVVNENDASEDDAEAAMLRMLEDLPQDDDKASPEDIDFGTAEVSKAEFQQLQGPAGVKDPQNIDLLMDVDLPVSIELGRTKLSIAEILALGPGSVVELNKLAGEPVDLLVNNKPVAKGEVVVVDENFGLRITQLMTPEERLKSLGKE